MSHPSSSLASRLPMDSNSILFLGETTPPLPPLPTRGQVCQIRSAMQGLMVTLPDYGTLPFFPPLLGWIDAKNRAALYPQLRAANVTHVIICVSGQYKESDTPYANIDGKDYSKDWPALLALVDECVREGFIVLLKMAGDGQSVVVDGKYVYNDPVGWTYGHDWLMANLKIITTLLKDYEGYILYSPGFDGVFAAADGVWTPAQLSDYLLTLRKTRLTCYSDLQFGIPYISDGDGGGFYDSPQGQALDSVSCEWDYPALTPGDPLNRFCQNSARLLGPKFICLYGCEPGPFYLEKGTPRGPFYANSFETSTFWFIHEEIDEAECLANQATFRSVGWLDTMPYPLEPPF